MLKDKVFKCIDCGQEFVWVLDEQIYYQQHGLKPPLRCAICRGTYKTAQEDKFRGKISR